MRWRHFRAFCLRWSSSVLRAAERIGSCLRWGLRLSRSFARVVRGEVLRLRESDYVISAKLIGVPTPRILFVHILPNILPALLSALAIGFNNAVLAEAGLSYLGIGVQPPDASLGRMLSEAQTYLASGIWCAVFPDFFLCYWYLAWECWEKDLGSVRRWSIMLKVENLTICFSDGETQQKVVSNVSFSIEKGEILGSWENPEFGKNDDGADDRRIVETSCKGG